MCQSASQSVRRPGWEGDCGGWRGVCASPLSLVFSLQWLSCAPRRPPGCMTISSACVCVHLWGDYGRRWFDSLCVCVCRMEAHNNETVPQKHCRVCSVKAHIACLLFNNDNNLIMTPHFTWCAPNQIGIWKCCATVFWMSRAPGCINLSTLCDKRVYDKWPTSYNYFISALLLITAPFRPHYAGECHSRESVVKRNVWNAVWFHVTSS